MDPIKDLEKLEITLVDERRKRVSEMTTLAGFEHKDAAVLVDIQRKIDAVKSAIEDEKSRAQSVYEAPATTL